MNDSNSIEEEEEEEEGMGDNFSHTHFENANLAALS